MLPGSFTVEVYRPEQVGASVRFSVVVVDGRPVVDQLSVEAARAEDRTGEVSPATAAALTAPAALELDEFGLPIPGAVFADDEDDIEPADLSGITGTDLRSIPVERWLIESVTLVAMPIVEARDGRIRASVEGDADPEAISALVRRRGELGSWKLDDDHLQQVAAIYRDAERLHERPIKAIQSRFPQPNGEPLPRGTASRWVDLARQKKYLPRKGRKS